MSRWRRLISEAWVVGALLVCRPFGPLSALAYGSVSQHTASTSVCRASAGPTAQAERRLYAASRQDGTVSVIDAANGALVSTIRVGPSPVIIAVDETVPNGSAFVADQARIITPSPVRYGPSRVSVLEAHSGRVLQTISINAQISSLAVDSRRGRLFLTAGDSRVWMLDASTLKILARLPLGANPVDVGIDRRNGHVFVDSADANGAGSVEMLDVRSGRLLATTTIGRQPGQLIVDERSGRVFVGNYGGTSPFSSLSMLDATTGRAVTTVPLNTGSIGLSLDEQAGRIFVTTGDNAGGGILLTLNSTSGHILSTVATVYSAVAIPDVRTKRLFVFGYLGSMVAVLDEITGQRLHSIHVGQNLRAIAVDQQTGCVFAAAEGPSGPMQQPVGKGTIYVLDGRTGIVLHATTVGRNPTALAVGD